MQGLPAATRLLGNALVGAAVGFVVGGLLTCSLALFIADCKLMHQADDPALARARLVQSVGLPIGPFVGAVIGVRRAIRANRNSGEKLS